MNNIFNKNHYGVMYVKDSSVDEYVSKLMYLDSSLPNNDFLTYKNTIAFLGSTGKVATRGQIYGGDATPISFIIVNELENCTFSNNDTEVVYGASYTNTITVTNPDYTIMSIQIIMGGIDITSTAYKDNTIYIEKVTGSIKISGKVGAGYWITQNIDNCSTTNKTESVKENSSFTTTITPNEGYKLIGVTVLMGTDDITSTAYKDGVVSIDSVTADVKITATATIITFTITEGTCDGVICENDETINYGDNLTITVTVKDNFRVKDTNITVTENNVEKAFTYSEGKIIVENVKGNIVYNIDAAEIHTVTYVLNNIISSNKETEITDQDTYTTTLSFSDTIYTNIDITITMGDKDITYSSYDSDTKTITVKNPSGDILINAEASTTIIKNHETKLDLMDLDWKFNKLREVSTETFDSNMVAANYDDSEWLTITLPYDWSIYNSFDSNVRGNEYESGWLSGGDAIYRTKVTIPSDYKGNRIYIHFDGIYMMSEVFINGNSVGSNKNGYIPFDFDITEYVSYGEENTIAVTVSNHIPSSRWYSGSGIYRNCWISMVNTSELGIEDITITTPNLASEQTGTVSTNIDFTIENVTSSDIILTDVIANVYQDWDSTLVGTATLTKQTLTANSENTFNLTVGVSSPTLWTTHDVSDTIRVYNTVITVKYVKDNIQYVISSNPEVFGYRYITYDANGFYLNGTKTFLKGMCEHHDNGILGAETYKDATERKLRILGASGCNCIRTTHAPQSNVFLDCAMRQGFMIIEEMFDGWRYSKNGNTYDYSRYFAEDNKYIEVVVKNTIKRDKNNPAIIMWSIGNEIDEGTTTSMNEQYISDAKTIIGYIQKYDTTRPTTIGNNKPTNTTAQRIMALVDIPGVNYGDDSEYSSLRSTTTDGVSFSNKCIYGSETVSAFYTRGVYTTDTSKQYFTCFDLTNTESANSHSSWGDAACVSLKRHQETYTWLSGTMPWTGFDYIGEPTPVNSKYSRSSFFGIVDLTGLVKDPYYMYQSQWTTTPMIHIVPENWSSYTEGDEVTVWVYSNCNTVKLHLNGTEITENYTPSKGSHYAYEYTVTYEKGTLVATGYDAEENGNIIAQDIRYTANDAYQIGLYSDKIKLSRTGLLYVECNIEDVHTVLVPDANNKVTFTCTGGQILGSDNGYPACLEDIRNSVQTCFTGKCVVVIKPNNDATEVTVTATADNLVTGNFSIAVENENVYKEETIRFIDPENPPVNPYILYYTMDNNTVHFDNGNSGVVTITKYPADATSKINLVSASEGFNVSIDNNYNTVTITNTKDDIKGEIVIECGYIKRTINVSCGTATNNTCTMSIDGDDTLTSIYVLEYLPVNFTVSEGEITSVNVIYGNKSVTYDEETKLIYGKNDGLGIIEVKLSTDEVYYFYITAVAWQDSSNNAISQASIASVYSTYYIDSITYDVDTTLTGDTKFQLLASTDTTFIGILDIDPSVTMVSTPLTTFGYDKTGKRKSYLFQWTGNTKEYLGYSLSLTNSKEGLFKINIRSYNAGGSFTYRVGTASCTDITVDTESLTISSDEENNKKIKYTITPSNTTDTVNIQSTNDYVKVSTSGDVYAVKNGTDTITITCGSVTKTISVTISNITEDPTILAYNTKIESIKAYYTGNDSGIDWKSNYTFYAALRIDNKTPTGNILSFGNNISAWYGTHYHIYYPSITGTTTIGNFSSLDTVGITIAMATSSGSIKTAGVTTELKGENNDIIYIVQNNNGLWINGTDATKISITSGAFDTIQSLTTVQIGSYEGEGRFDGTILEMRKIMLENLADDYSETGLTATELEEISNNGLDMSKYLQSSLIKSVSSNTYNAANISRISNANIISVKPTLSADVISYNQLNKLEINSSIDVLLVNPHHDNGYILGYSNNTIGYSDNMVVKNAGTGFNNVKDVNEQINAVLNSEYYDNFVYTLTKINDNTYTLVAKNSYSPIGDIDKLSWDNNSYIEFNIDNDIKSITSLCKNIKLKNCIRLKNTYNCYLSSQGSPKFAKFTYNNSEWSVWNLYKVN